MATAPEKRIAHTKGLQVFVKTPFFYGLYLRKDVALADYSDELDELLGSENWELRGDFVVVTTDAGRVPVIAGFWILVDDEGKVSIQAYKDVRMRRSGFKHFPVKDLTFVK